MHMHISYKPEVQACDDFKTLMYTSKGEQINFRAKYLPSRFTFDIVSFTLAFLTVLPTIFSYCFYVNILEL